MREADPCATAGVRVSSLGPVLRIDVNGVGAALPAGFGTRRDGADDPDFTAKNTWVSGENARVVQFLAETAGRYGGDFRSFAEWTVTDNWFHMAYGSGDGGIRARRGRAFGPGYRAAISSLNWLHPDALVSGRLQATAFVPSPGASFRVPFSQTLWRPSVMADYESFVVAPAVLTRWDDVTLVHVAGVLGVDAEFRIVGKDDPPSQIRHVLETIVSVVEEAGGRREDVIRLRPFVNDGAMGRIVAEVAQEVWRGCPEPARILADDMSFSAGSPYYIETQAVAMIGARHVELARDGALRVRRADTASWSWLEAGEIAVPESADAPRRAALRASALLAEHGWGPGQVSVLFGYAAGPAAGAAVEQELLRAGFPRDALHIVPSRQMSDASVKLSLVAVREA